MVCEHCGRILVDDYIMQDEAQPIVFGEPATPRAVEEVED